MPIRIDSADYNNIAGTYPTLHKFDSLNYSVVGSATYVTVSGQVTAWSYPLVISASGSALGAGVSAGGMDTLRASFSRPTALTIVTDEAVTATAYFRNLKVTERLNPTMYQVEVEFVRA